MLLGNSLTFTATVAGSMDTGVSWSVNQVAGGTAASGTITAAGVYTAPGDLPAGAVTVTAISHADSTKAASAAVTVVSDVALGLTPGSAGIELGAVKAFLATVTSAGIPDTNVRWSVGLACGTNCGSVDASGNYTAPRILPGNPSVAITAQSVADPSKQASANGVITSGFTLRLSAPGNVAAGAAAAIVATLTPVPGSNPDTALTWALSGPGCSGASCGTLTAVTTQSSGGNASLNSATYTAPQQAPVPDSVTITVTPLADASKQAQASLTIQTGISVSVTPGTATLAANHRVTLTAQVNGTTSTGVTWGVNGIAGGNPVVGQVCSVGSNPCAPVAANALQADYAAPGAIPNPNPASVTATSAADTTKMGSAQITVINHVLVSVQPASVTLPPLGVQPFTASVLGATNQAVVWRVEGTGCASAGCGSVDANGIYMAPPVAPVPNTLQVMAISSDDTTQSAAATVTISTGANVMALHPASVYAGAANGFTLRADGSGFVATSGGSGSVLLIGGAARTTTCVSAQECTAAIAAADVASAGSLSVQARNPDGSRSNAVSLVVAAPNASDEVIALSSAAPSATGKDIVVVEPTTAGVSQPGLNLDLNVAAIGAFTTATNTCALTGNPVALTRPATGVATSDICLFSQSGFDASMTYTISGSGDVMVLSKQPAGLGMIHLTLQVAANAAPGARTLFIQNTNLDKIAASGALEVQ